MIGDCIIAQSPQNIGQNTSGKRREIDNHALVRIRLIKDGLRILRRRMGQREMNEVQIVMALLEVEARAQSVEGYLMGRDTSRHRLHRWSFDDESPTSDQLSVDTGQGVL